MEEMHAHRRDLALSMAEERRLVEAEVRRVREEDLRRRREMRAKVLREHQDVRRAAPIATLASSPPALEQKVAKAQQMLDRRLDEMRQERAAKALADSQAAAMHGIRLAHLEAVERQLAQEVADVKRFRAVQAARLQQLA